MRHPGRASGLAGFAAAACGVHCLLTPALLVLAPALALPEAAEGWLLLVTVVVGGGIVLSGCRVHRRAAVSLVLLVGAGVWAASLQGWLSPLPEAVTSPAGSLTAASALFWNARLLHRCGCGSCDEEEGCASAPTGPG